MVGIEETQAVSWKASLGGCFSVGTGSQEGYEEGERSRVPCRSPSCRGQAVALLMERGNRHGLGDPVLSTLLLSCSGDKWALGESLWGEAEPESWTASVGRF